MISYHGIDADFSLKDKTAIVTGGASGIGFATAEFFAKKGVNLVLADLNQDADKIAKKLGQKNIAVIGDVTDGNYRKKVLNSTVDIFGGVDILVNSAGIGPLDKAETLSEDKWDKTLNVNLKASFMMAQIVGAYFIKNKRPGSIVNIASQAGVVALEGHVAYSASKGGVISMTKALAFEWGKHDIRVNAVSPTVVLTELGKVAWGGSAGDEFKKQMPSERFAEPDEIAAIIAFLCSNAAAMITGHNLIIDGGYTIR
jgi:NAD(P)-dependent dehydrogenase (short-subunit alcohol dehydrogenase family)